jgi:4-amino-4-deoxy-L-arabinose transferase-like glycosyltransferase
MGAVLVVALAIAVRVTWVLLVPSKPVGDFAMYLESAAHLLEHGALDPEFVYMPGYVAAVALVQGLGGGLLAVKLLLGAGLGGLGAGAVYGLGAAFWGRREAGLAGLAYALWPAGVAVSSVTGTDMPATVLVLAAARAVVKWGRARPWLAVLLFGLTMGLGAYVRAVAVPLAAFSLFYFLAVGVPWRKAAAYAGASVLTAFLLLSPWVLRNRWHYGEWMLTDSHGGLTALVGANPNTEGRYSRSLNRLFQEVTGYTLLAPPHRAADRAGYALAREFTDFSPAYAAGLVALKAERLLDRERPLLYWPLYRAGVLAPGSTRSWFDRNRRAIEAWTDGFWLVLVSGFFAGVALALARRRWAVIAFLPIQLALAGIYSLYFAEGRYHLPVAGLMFPVAAGVLTFLLEATAPIRRRIARELGRRRASLAPAPVPAAGGRPLRHDLLAMALALLLLYAGWPAAKAAGQELRRGHRWAAHVCHVSGRPVVCKWKSTRPGASPVRGVYDGMGLDLSDLDASGRAAARTSLPLPPGHHTLHARLDITGGAMPPLEDQACRLSLAAGGAAIAEIPLAAVTAASGRSDTVPVALGFESRPGVDIDLTVTCPPGPRRQGTVWLSGLEVGR